MSPFIFQPKFLSECPPVLYCIEEILPKQILSNKSL